MKGRRASVGAELVPLVLSLACLAGSLTLIVSAQRRRAPRRPVAPAVALVTAQAAPRPAPKPTPPPVVDEPEPPPPPAPADPTPAIVAKLIAAEAEQLLEASKADRRATALEEARKSAVAESERWRRRESLVHAQLGSLDGKLRQIERDVDAMALERDALEKEIDARKAAAARDRSRPGRAILPHKGPNGTWRRPIVVECRNGTATLQPKGQEFGLMELESGFGPSSNPFVAAVAREAIRINGKASPDGEPVVPYIFFVVRPDGIRPYYEARGRLEPLGITFGYELADQDWEIDFPDLDDVKAWDGSTPRRSGEELAAEHAPGGARGGGTAAEDADIPTWVRPDRGRRAGSEFEWPARPRYLPGGRAEKTGGPDLHPGAGPLPGAGEVAESPPPGYPGGMIASDPPSGDGPKAAGAEDDRQTPGEGSDPAHPRIVGDVGSSGVPTDSAAGRIGSTLAAKGGEKSAGADLSPNRSHLAEAPRISAPSRVGPGTASPSEEEAQLPSATVASRRPGGSADGPGDAGADPGVAFVWPRERAAPRRDKRPPGPMPAGETDPTTSPHSSVVARDDDIEGRSPSNSTEGRAGSGPVGGAASGGGQPARVMLGQAGTPGGPPPDGSPPPAGPMGVGIGMASPSPPPQGLPPSSPPVQLPKARPSPPSLADPASKIVDRTFEVVVVCGPRGLIVQPGGYRVTSDALRDREGLFKKQIVGLVKARRSADLRVTIEPRIRFLVQPGGSGTYRIARSQFLLSGLDWPASFHVADPDPLAVLPSEVW